MTDRIQEIQLPDKNFHFGISNQSGKLTLYFDGVEVNPKHMADFSITGWHYSNKYVKEVESRSKLQRIWRIIRSEDR